MSRRVVGRKVIRTNTISRNKETSLERLLTTVAEIEADTSVALFKKKPKPLTSSQAEYNKCLGILKLINENEQSKEEIKDISIRELCSFFSMFYYQVYQFNCIDYNYFNAKKTFEILKDNFKLDTNIDVMLLVCKTVDTFSVVKRNLNLKDDVPTVGTFKQRWIISEVISPSGKFEGFY